MTSQALVVTQLFSDLDSACVQYFLLQDGPIPQLQFQWGGRKTLLSPIRKGYSLKQATFNLNFQFIALQ